MKIFIVEPRGSGGMIHYAYQLCSALSSCGSEVTLVTAKLYELDQYPHAFKLNKMMNLWTRHDRLSTMPMQNPIARLGWKVFRNIRRVFRGARFYGEWVRLTFYLLKERPDIVQFGAIEFAFETVFLQFLKSRGLTLTQICHEFERREKGDSLPKRINDRLLKNAFEAFSVIFFHSPSNIDRFRELYPEIPPDRFHLIPMGNGQIFPKQGDHTPDKYDLMKRYDITQDDKVVLFFGNITPSKGIPDLLNAFEKVQAQNNHARLVIAGAPLKYIDVNSLFDQAEKLGIQSVAHFDTRYLPMEEVAPLMDLATVVVFPYITSTQSGSIQAAYAFGKPVIATRVGGLPDVVVEGESGFLVDPGSPEQLSGAILKVINDDEMAEKMGQFAKKLSETRYAWGPIAENIMGVYRNVLS